MAGQRKYFYFLGLDLGQQNDFTALTVSETILDTMEYNVPLVYRYPLRTDYTSIVTSVKNFIDYGKVRGKPVALVVDYTGVGRPVVDLFRREGVRLIALNITGGAKVNWDGFANVSVPKGDIVSNLQVLLQNRRIKFSGGIPIIDEVKKEFLNFRATIKKPSRGSFEAASGFHDDIVMSLGIALWYAEYRFGKSSRVVAVSGESEKRVL